VPHRRVSHDPSAYVSAGFSPLYGKKKGGFGEPRVQKKCGQRCLVGGYLRPPQCIGLKAQEKSGSGRGANAAGAASDMTNAHATIYDKDMRRAFP
jgi:hypothetical protein